MAAKMRKTSEILKRYVELAFDSADGARERRDEFRQWLDPSQIRALVKQGLFDTTREAREFLDFRAGPPADSDEVRASSASKTSIDAFFEERGPDAATRASRAAFESYIISLGEPFVYKFRAPLLWASGEAAAFVEAILEDRPFDVRALDGEPFRTCDLFDYQVASACVKGSVRARTIEQARRRIRAVVEEYQGAFLAIGLVREIDPESAVLRGFEGIHAFSNSGTMEKTRYDASDKFEVELPFELEFEPDASDMLERQRIERGSVPEVVARRIGRVRSLFAEEGNSTVGARAVRRACALFLRALRTRDRGETSLFFAACLEGMLIDGDTRDDLAARVRDASALLVSRNHAERARVRGAVSALYDARSKFVHGQACESLDFDEDDVRQIVRIILRHEIEMSAGSGQREGE